MRRLLSFLRQSQDECNDSECFDLTNMRLGEGTNSGVPDNNLMMYSFMWIVIGFLLYFFRPQSLRNAKSISDRSHDNNDDSGPPPMAPEAH